jgi:hypothetical protein
MGIAHQETNISRRGTGLPLRLAASAQRLGEHIICMGIRCLARDSTVQQPRATLSRCRVRVVAVCDTVRDSACDVTKSVRFHSNQPAQFSSAFPPRPSPCCVEITRRLQRNLLMAPMSTRWTSTDAPLFTGRWFEVCAPTM